MTLQKTINASFWKIIDLRIKSKTCFRNKISMIDKSLPTIISIVSAPSDIKFLRKLSPGTTIKDDILYIHTTLFSYLHSLNFLRKNHIIFKMKKHRNLLSSEQLLEYARFNVKANLLSKDEAIEHGSSFYSNLNELFIKHKFDLAFILSGRMLSHQILAHICRETETKTVYFGYGNFPGKTFIDIEGTDKASRYYKHFENTNDLVSDNFLKWKKSYFDKKLLAHHLPQGRNLGLMRFYRILRYFICLLERILKITHDTNYKLRDVIYNAISISNIKIEKLKHHSNFGFHALQLSTDAQVILHSSISQNDAIKEFIDECMARNLTPVLKVHPSETSTKFISNLVEIQKENPDIVFTKENTYELMMKSSFVYVINSTVGLEAKMLGKEVIFAEECIFSKMELADIEKYIMSDLLDLDFFDDASIDAEGQKRLQSL